MRYFNNITTKEELKKRFRELSISLHPDRGGNAEDFAAMMAEYEEINKDFERIKAEEQRRREAEEQRKRYEEEERKEREEAERKEKEAAEALKPIIAKWAQILETVPESPSYNADQKTRAAYTAAVKRNVKRIFAHYFPGVEIKITISSNIYHDAVISWQDGPTVEEVESLNEWALFTGHVWVSDPYADYGQYKTVKSTAAWRERFGSVYSGFEFTRTFSEVVKGAMYRVIWETIPAFNGCVAGNDSRECTLNDIVKLFNVCEPNAPQWHENMTDEEVREYNRTQKIRKSFTTLFTYYTYAKSTECLSALVKRMEKYWRIPSEVTEAAKAESEKPVFVPVYGKQTKAIMRALGTGKEFAIYNGKNTENRFTRCNLLEALEASANGSAVVVVSWSFCEYSAKFEAWATDAGGRKVIEKRNVKFAPLGISFVVHYNSYGFVQIDSVTAETLDTIRAEFAEVEKQRAQWEEEQKNQSTKAEKKGKKAEKQESTAEAGEILAEADGVTLTRSERGAEFSGNTYAHHAEIKTLGARWYRVGQVWTIKAEKIAEAVEMVNSWNDGEATTENEPQQTETAQAEPAEAEEPQQEQPQSEPAEAEETTQGGEMSEDLAGAFAQVVTMCADIFGTASTASAEEPQQESEPAPAEAETTNTPEAGKGARIVFAASDTPELDEIHTPSESATPGSSEHLASLTEEEREKVRRTFERGASEAETATDQNEHTRAIYLQGLALLFLFDGARALTVNDLLNVLQAIENRANERGHILPDEITARAEIADTLTACTVQAYGAELAAILWGSSQVARVNGKRRAA